MQADDEAEDAASKITGRHEPALGEADGVLDDDGVETQPFDVEQEGKRLLDVCPEQVEDEDDELVGALRLDLPLDETVGEQGEQGDGRDKGQEAEGDDGAQPWMDVVRQVWEGGRVGIQTLQRAHGARDRGRRAEVTHRRVVTGAATACRRQIRRSSRTEGQRGRGGRSEVSTRTRGSTGFLWKKSFLVLDWACSAKVLLPREGNGVLVCMATPM